MDSKLIVLIVFISLCVFGCVNGARKGGKYCAGLLLEILLFVDIYIVTYIIHSLFMEVTRKKEHGMIKYIAKIMNNFCCDN